MNRVLDLDSYSASPGWLGYFELVDRSSRRKDAISAIRRVQKQLGEVTVVLSCYTIGGNAALQQDYEVPEADIVDIIDPLRAADLVRTYQDYREAEPLRRVLKVAEDKVEKVCLAMMDVDGVRGHLFLVSGHGIIVYPHDDIGFGFLSVSEASKEAGRDILSRFLADGLWQGRLA